MRHARQAIIALLLSLSLAGITPSAEASPHGRFTKADALRAWMAQNTVSPISKPRVHASDVQVQSTKRLVRVTTFGPGVCDPRKTRLCLERRPVEGRMDIRRIGKSRVLMSYHRAKRDRFELAALWLSGARAGVHMDVVALLSDGGDTWSIGGRETRVRKGNTRYKRSVRPQSLASFIRSFGPRTLEKALDTISATPIRGLDEESVDAFLGAVAERGNSSYDSSAKDIASTGKAHGEASNAVKRVFEVLNAAINPSDDAPSEEEMDRAQDAMVDGAEAVADNGKKRAFGIPEWLMKLFQMKKDADKSECFEELSTEEIKRSLGL